MPGVDAAGGRPLNVLFVGLGSIGARHLRSCLRVRPNHRYAALRSGPDAPAHPGALDLYSWEEALSFRPDIAWICTPTSMHREPVERLAAAGCALFVEKPLAHLAEDARAMSETIASAGLPFFYGCLLRGHPLIGAVGKMIVSGELGEPMSYTLHAGSYLPDWRPGRDYRETYSARRELGGGVGLDLIHEFDYAEAWFGPIRRMIGWRGKRSGLEIDADDSCMAICFHASGVIGQVSLSYARPIPSRGFEVVFPGAVLEGDLPTGRLTAAKREKGGQPEIAESCHSCPVDELHDIQSAAVLDAAGTGGPGLRDPRDVARLVTMILGLESGTATPPEVPVAPGDAGV